VKFIAPPGATVPLPVSVPIRKAGKRGDGGESGAEIEAGHPRIRKVDWTGDDKAIDGAVDGERGIECSLLERRA
jgi:hypothetical protein